MKSKSDPCVIVGAGIAGLLAASKVQSAGLPVVVLDKGRGVGGRMATRRIQQGVFDHGAQFFTTREPEFRDLVASWQKLGIVKRWSLGFAGADGAAVPDSHPRYRGHPAMTAVPKQLAGSLDVRLNSKVRAIKPGRDSWGIDLEGGETLIAGALLLTPPVPQSLALLEAGGALLPRREQDALAAIQYTPCLAVLLLTANPNRIPEPGGLQLQREPIHWLADNHQKGISPHGYALTLHAGPQFSRENWEAADETIAEALLKEVSRWIDQEILTFQVQRWRYSQPDEVYPERGLVIPGTPPLLFAGDAFGGPRVEGAALSGLWAAEKLTQILTGA